MRVFSGGFARGWLCAAACSGEYEVRVDRRGRLVLPAEVRRLLGLENGGRLVLRVRGGWVELVPPGGRGPGGAGRVVEGAGSG
ncbi:AbrB/MazE/SpoVT family DNA-binding domain-containing protein [Pyrodictium abyssi]|uniref:SpoVT-AbrB domain-containing protein n=1 Tax=Pyrodictium abyssi TaxID=54256 RepID=A0ABM8IXZ7_9CREN|nr:hypothetical protein PABY_19610 [Pyrodictium abyssi]